MPLPEREEETTGSENARPADGARPIGPLTDEDLRAALPRGWLQAIRGAADRPEHPDPPARLRGRYERRLQLGRGGMGGVWRYFDTHTRRDVAIKFAYEGREDALREEVEVLAQLDHPSIPRALDAGDDGGFTFAVFPLIEGPTLHAMITARRPSTDSLHEEVGATRPSARPSPGGATPSTKAVWPVRPADSITQPAAEDDAPPAPPSKAEAVRLLSAFRDLTTALGAMHRRGLLHIDIKPANIMLGPDGRGYLIDFGLASGSDGGEDGGARGGTPHYMSPEQASGVGGLDFRSDIYSLGVTLHEGLTGVRVVRPPDGLGTRARADWIKSTVTTTPVPKLTTVAPSLREILGKDTTAALEAVLDKACRKNPAERYATAESLDSDLARAAAGREPERAVAPRFVRRRRLTIAATVAITLCTAAFALRSCDDAERHRTNVKAISNALDAAEKTRGSAGDLLPIWELIGERRRLIESDPVLAADQRRFIKTSSVAFASEAILGQCLTIYDAGRRMKPGLNTAKPRHQRYAAAAEALRGFGGDEAAADVVEAFGAYVDLRLDDVDHLLARCAGATGELAQLRSTLIVCAGFPRMMGGNEKQNEERKAAVNHHMSELGIAKNNFAPKALSGLPLACAAFVYIAGLEETDVGFDAARVAELEQRLHDRLRPLADFNAADPKSPAALHYNYERAEVLMTLASRLAFARGDYALTISHLDALLASEPPTDNIAAIKILRAAAALRLVFDAKTGAESPADVGAQWQSDLAEGLAAAPSAIGSFVDLLLVAPERAGKTVDETIDKELAKKATTEACLAALECILRGPQFRWTRELSRREATSPEIARLAIAAIAGMTHADGPAWTRVTSCLLTYIAGAGTSSTNEAGLDSLHPGSWTYGCVDDALKSGDHAAALKIAQAAHDSGVGVRALNDAALGRAHVKVALARGLPPDEQHAHFSKARGLLRAALHEETGLPEIRAQIEARMNGFPAADRRRGALLSFKVLLDHIIENEVKPDLAKIPPEGP